MEGLGSRAWKTARLPGVSLPKPGAPHTCRSSPCMVNGYEKQLWLSCRRGSCLGLMGEGGPSLACLDVGSLVQGLPGSPRSLGLQGGWLVGRAGAGRPPCPPWSARPSAVCWKLLSFHTVGPSVSQVSGGTGMLGWLGLPGGCLPFRLVFCRSSAPWIPGLLPVALHLPILRDARVCMDQCLPCIIQLFHCSGPEWVMPRLSRLVKGLGLSSPSLTPISALKGLL